MPSGLRLPQRMPMPDIESVMREERVFKPSKEFSSRAHVKSFADYEALYERAATDPDGFWAEEARALDWAEPWQKVLEWHNPWYHEHIGGGRCPIVDTWWQTESGGIMISPLPGATPAKPGSCTRPLPGIIADVVTREGRTTAPNEGGYLIVRRPWPAMLRGVYGDPDRYTKYWTEIDGIYFAGDGARRDDDGYFWVMGRIDDVVNVAGHRLGTAEVESALVSHPAVAESAVVGRPDELKGQGLVAFVTLKKGIEPAPKMTEDLKAHVVREIGAIARPDEIRFTEALPKTRSGKIMRRLLKEIATTGAAKGDVTTLEDLGILTRLSKADEE